MSNLSICYLNIGDIADLTAIPSEVSSMPVAYIQNDSRGSIFGAVASGIQTIVGDWGGVDYTVGCVKLDRTNLVSGDTWRIQLYSDTTLTTLIYDSGTIAVFATGLYSGLDYSSAELFFTSVTGVKSFKITTTSVTALRVCRLFIGPTTVATYNPQWGMMSGWETNSSKVRTDGGSFRSLFGSTWRTLSFDMLLTTESERSIWYEIGRYCSNTKSLWISVFPGVGGAQERDHSIIGKFEASPIIKWGSFNQFDFSVKLSEI